MATTTAVTYYRSAGQPDDSVGSVGDICKDTVNRIDWVKQSNNSWVNGALSTIGPVGPAQLSYNGVPPASFGQNGNGCTDQSTALNYIKVNNVWVQVGTNAGPTTTLMSQLATSAGPYGAFASVTLSSTPYVVPIPGSTFAAQFTPQQSSAFMGVYCYASAACTLSLVDTSNSNAVVWSVSVSANQSIANQNYTSVQYPLTANHTYQWQVTGSASTTLLMQPFYLTPSNTNAPAISVVGGAGFSNNTTFSSTAQNVPVFGLTSAQGRWGYAPPRAGGIYSAQATYFPSGSTTSSNSVNIALNYAKLSDGSGAANNLTTTPVTANGQPQTFITPRLTDQNSTFLTGYFFFWTVTGSGTGYLDIKLLAIV